MVKLNFLESAKKQAKLWADSKLRFVEDSFLDNLDNLSYDQLHNLPFGVIELDDLGIVQFYNNAAYENKYIKEYNILGKNFFTEVAPSMNNFIFIESFHSGVENNDMNFLFPYTFTCKINPTLVKIHFYRTKKKKNFVLIMQSELHEKSIVN